MPVMLLLSKTNQIKLTFGRTSDLLLGAQSSMGNRSSHARKSEELSKEHYPRLDESRKKKKKVPRTKKRM